MKKILTGSVAIWALTAFQAQAQELPGCQMIATGGTIAMKNDPQTGAPVPAVSGEDLLATVPGIQKVARIEVDNISNIPSANMNPERWQALQQKVVQALARPDIAGVIISHGTDTLEETAYFMALSVASPKPIILIGAQRNNSDFDFDGPRNLLNAARLCVSPQARNKGAMLVMNGQINAAREVTKSHATDVETFKSGDAGFLGNVDEDRIVFYRAPTNLQHVPLGKAPLPYVEIVPTYGGVTPHLLKAAVAAGAKGIVVEAVGIGNVNYEMFDAIKEVMAQGIPVVIASRVYNGRVISHYGYKGGSKQLKDAGAIMGGSLSAQKARILLMLALQTRSSAADIQPLFDR